MADVERRFARGPVELRASADGESMLAGYAAAFNRMSQNLGGFVERIAPGAFTRTLNHAGDVVARYNHSDDWLLGRTSSGTLRVWADERGLPYEIDLPDTQAGRDVRELARRGDLRNSSFAFKAITDDWSTTEDGTPLRELREVQLIDVAPVTSPAYLDTSVSLRSLAVRLGTGIDDVAEIARRGGLAALITHELPPVDLSTEIKADPSDPHSAPIDVRVRRAEWISRR
jgi:HK97 family phage prohead protease